MNQGNAHSDNANQHLADQYKNTYDKAAGLTGFAASFAPGYGDGTDIVETLTGKDMRTGEKLPLWQRGVTGAAMLVPIIGGSAVRSALNGLGEAVEGAVKHTDEAADVVSGALKSSDEVVAGAGEAVKILKPQNLMDELANSGVKYSPDDVVTVTKTPDGQLRWLEKGNDSSGLKHIFDGHATDFANRGVNDIPNFLNRTLQEVPAKTGIGARGSFADYLMDGKMYRVAYGTNGYIVSFFPLFE